MKTLEAKVDKLLENYTSIPQRLERIGQQLRNHQNVAEQDSRDSFLREFSEDPHPASPKVQDLRKIYKEVEEALYWIYRAFLEDSNPSDAEIEEIKEVNKEIELLN